MENLLNRLEALGISLAANEDNLDVYDPNENLSEGLISEIKHNKSQLLRLLKISPNTEFKEIPRIPRTSYYPLSSAQSRMHFMQQMEPQTTSYNISKVVTLEEIELERLQRTLHLLTQRHESLRTKFAIINDEPVQIISDNLEIKIELFSEKDGDADKLIHDFIRPFDLHEGPLFRVGLVEKSSGEGLLLLDFHHIIVDGISLDILFKEFSMIYMGQDLAGPKIQYVDYVAWTQSAYYRKDIANQKIFWLKEYAELPSSLDLPTDNNRSENQLKEGQVYRFGFDEALTRSLKELAKANKSTDFMLMYTLYLLFLSKITAQNDVVIGIPTAGRLHADLDEVVGMFTNTLTVRNHIPAESSFEGFLLMVKTKLLQCFENQAYQYEELIDEIKVPRDIHRNPLFDVMFSFQNFKNEPSGKTKNNKKLRLEKSNAKFDLMLTTGTRNEQFYLNLQYDTGLFNSKTIAAFASYMETIARKVVAEPKAPIAELSLLPQDSSRQLADTMKRSIAPEYKMSVIDLFDKNVTSYKNKTALFSEGRSMTYNDLYETSNRIAQVLIKDYGIGKNQLVGVKANRSIELISCLFGILKSGSAYVPIYINDPQDRVAKIATDAGLQIIITDDVDINPNAFPQTQIVQLSGIMEKAQQFDAEPPKVSLNKDDLAYVIYTSGSTGTPKGVMIEHHSLINLIQDLQKRYPLKKDDSYLFKTSCSFDVSVAEIFGWFAEGGSLVILDQGAEEDPSEILSCIDKLKVTHSSFAPSMFSVVVSHLEATGTPSIESLKYVLLAGEVLPMELVKRFNLLEAKAKLENLYGPTEGTVYSSAYSTENIKDEKSVPIGQPISNVEMYIFDEHMNLLPYGIKGELCLGGIGLARGYLNNEDLTQERFVPDPYDSSKRLYKTGDIARIREDGNVEFFGRKDHQLKVHGFRIEAGEIESCLLEYEGITEAVVATKEENEDQYLVAYYVAEEEMDPLTIKNYISDKVSRYMVPAQFVHLAEMPLNASGKIDRKALPDVENTTRDVYEPPANEMEEKMTEIWADILKIDKSRISVTSSFFELGGHSLRATKLVNKVYREMGVQILLKDLFNNKTIRSLSKFVTEGIQTEFVKIEKAEERDSYPLSSAQKRIYFLYEFDKKSTAYNVTTTVRVIGDIDKDKIDKAINKLIERHEILRTTFHLVDDEPVQVIHDTIDFQVETYSLEAGINGSVTKNFIKPFDLAVGPLIRAVLLETPEKDTFLMIDIHHIIADGISKGILFREFKKLLHDKSLPDLKLQYKDYAVWQQGTQQEALAKKQKMFWLNEYSYTLEAIDLPADYERPLFRDYLGSSLDLALEENVGGRIQSITKQNEATYFMFFLTVYNILISKLSGQKDIVIGTPTSGRQHDDLEQLVGMFVNTLAIRNQIKNEYTFEDLLAHVKAKCLRCFENQGYQYETLIEDLNIPRDTGRNPLFDLMLTYQNNSAQSDAAGVAFETVVDQSNYSKFDLTLGISEYDKVFKLQIEYSTQVFKSETAQKFLTYLKRIIDQVIENPSILLSEIELIDEDERNELINSLGQGEVVEFKEHNVLRLFEEQVDKTPHHVALRFDDHELTYQQLADRVNKIANYLVQQKEVNHGTAIGVLLNREEWLVPCIYAILKCGGIYIPINPSDPTERILGIMKDSGIRMLLTREEMVEVSSLPELSLIDLNKDTQQIEECGVRFQGSEVLKDDPAYVIYTSGSTGNPKGVMITHASLANLIQGMQEKYPLDESDNFMFKTTHTFDVSMAEIFGWFLKGGSLTLLPAGGESDPEQIVSTIRAHGVTHINFVPSMFRAFLTCIEKSGLEEISSLKYIFLAGEALPPELTQRFLEQNSAIALENIYGPTEATIYTSAYSVSQVQDRSVPIGRPLDNVSLYILDENHQLVPKGVKGELCIGGKGLAVGYFHNEDLTKQKFIENQNLGGQRVYLTGDYARWLPNGDIDFLGRIDHQVKLRGFRIELDEIRYYLNKHQQIDDSLVVLNHDNEDDYLVGYYVSDEELNTGQLMRHLVQYLPHYMIPTYFVRLDQIPLSTSGKVDKNALPQPQINQGEIHKPASDLENELAIIWGEVLKMEPSEISVSSTFFELGGHSLKAIVLMNKLHQKLNVKISLQEILYQNTIQMMAEHIEMFRWLNESKQEGDTKSTNVII